jgi:hypothetical protein
MIMSDLRI